MPKPGSPVKDGYLPSMVAQRSRRQVSLCPASAKLLVLAILWVIALAGLSSKFGYQRFFLSTTEGEPFFANVTTPKGICDGPKGKVTSHSGYIGLKGDSEATPKRSFFWYFEAESSPESAPVILTMGGGPGTSGMMNLMFGQSPCKITSDGPVPNSNRWTEKFNLVALDHPIGAGYSYGARVDNSRAAAEDAYDFLQKFFRLFPHLVKNQFVITSGSYGGVYVPNIASVIHEQNIAIANGRGQQGAVHINLYALMISNPISDPLSHYTWALYYRCVEKQVFNSTTCTEKYTTLPRCLDRIRYAYQHPTVDNRWAALGGCYEDVEEGDTHGILVEDVRRTCEAPPGDLNMTCHPDFRRVTDFFNNSSTKDALGVPASVNFDSINREVNKEFSSTGEMIQPHYLLYEPLIKAGVRLLHFIGAQDANCAWPGVLSFLKLINSPFQKQFIAAPDIPWLEKGNATVRAVGEGAGNFTYILLADAGHMVVKDQTEMVKSIVERWIDNLPWFPQDLDKSSY